MCRHKTYVCILYISHTVAALSVSGKSCVIDNLGQEKDYQPKITTKAPIVFALFIMHLDFKDINEF